MAYWPASFVGLFVFVGLLTSLASWLRCPVDFVDLWFRRRVGIVEPSACWLRWLVGCVSLGGFAGLIGSATFVALDDLVSLIGMVGLVGLVGLASFVGIIGVTFR